MYKVVSSSGWVYTITAFDSSYGDVQWMIDREHEDGRCEPAWAQCDTKAGAIATISQHEEG